MTGKKYLEKMPRKRVRMTDAMVEDAISLYIRQNFYESDDVKVFFGHKYITATFRYCEHDYDTTLSYGQSSVWWHKCKHCGHSWKQDDS